jgi:hypothetical protein
VLADAPPRVGWLVQLGRTTAHRRAGHLGQARDPADTPIPQRSGRRTQQQPALPLGQVRRDQREGRYQHLIQVHIATLPQPLTLAKSPSGDPQAPVAVGKLATAKVGNRFISTAWIHHASVPRPRGLSVIALSSVADVGRPDAPAEATCS